MKNQTQSKYFRILAIAPSSRGFGFALLEGQETLADWGVKQVKGDKTVESFKRVEELIIHYEPDVLVMEDAFGKNVRRSPRIKALGQEVILLAESRKIKVAMLSREQVRRRFFARGLGSKHALATILAQRFPEELGSSLPPKRRLWMSEDRRMDMFDAVGLALAFRLKTTKAINPMD